MNTNATNRTAARQPLGDLSIHPHFAGLLEANQITSLDSLFDDAIGRQLGKPGLSSWRERLEVRLQSETGEQVLYLKRFRHPPRKANNQMLASGCGARSIAGLEFAWMQILSDLAINCATPVALGEELIAGRERRSAILMTAVPGQSLESWCSEMGKLQDRQPGLRPELRRLCCEVATLVARLHANGIFHKDLYLSHLFYDPESPDAESVSVIDLQRMVRRGQRSIRRIVKDLAALHYSTPTALVPSSFRMRWLKQYLAVSKLDYCARRLAYRVIGKTAAITRHDRKRQKRLAASA